MSAFVLQVVTTPSGGGAQFIAKSLSTINCSCEIDYGILYFTSLIHIPSYNEYSLHIDNPRSPRAIFSLRSFLLKLSSCYSEIIVHAHLTWPFYYSVIASLWHTQPSPYLY